MSEEKKKPEADKAAPPAAGAKSGGAMRWVMVGGILALFIGVEVGLAMWFVKKLKPEDPAVKALAEEQEMDKRKQEELTEMGETMEEPIEVTVNITGTDGERFLKASVNLEWEEGKPLLKSELEARRPKLKNIVIDLLSSRPIAELMTLEGKKSIREAIVADVNAILPDQVEKQEVGKVRRAFFEEFIIQ